ncbi:hypothetical protein [Limosilactobacillus kribbianus]|uniref:hypothetical protein n=1 Tax=Limosilactobacillus kribbianus TaxID=2982695 RepID=UPI002263DA59|nr:hypothetical protein [Limosilactobacillus kribbianus]
MELVPEVDKEATIKRVKQFFYSADQYPQIRRRAWFAGIKSPQIDATGVHGSRKGNASEDMMIDYAYYAQAKRAVDIAIKGCSKTGMFPSQQILRYHYVEQLDIQEVKMQLGSKFGHDTYKRADDYACYEFADVMDGVSLAMRVDRKLIPKFIVKKREVNRN